MGATSDPRKIGPGFWASWHIRTLNFTSKEDQELAKIVIERDIRNFPCMECRGHAMEYLAKNPINIDGEKYTLFSWTVDFHNAVNMRLGKDYIDIQDAKKLWSGENVCLEDCSEEGTVMIDTKEIENKHPDYVYKLY